MTTTVKAALLGVEHPHSLAHLRTLQALPEVSEIFLWDESAEALRATQQSHPAKVVAVTTDLDQVLGRDDIFFVLAALRNDLGPDLFIRTLAAGKHLMAEKPIGRNAADTARVIAAAERYGRQLSVCYQNRALPAIAQARALVTGGIIGPLISTEMRMITTQCACATRRSGYLVKPTLVAASFPGWAVTISTCCALSQVRKSSR